MGALVMFGLVSTIAIIGVIYFNHQDKNKLIKSRSSTIRRITNTYFTHTGYLQ